MTQRPADTEYAPYYTGYISLVPEDDILPVLTEQIDSLRRVAAGVAADRETFRYAPGKWSVREVFGHLADAERVFGYRAFSIGRGGQAPLPGFDQDAFMVYSGFDRRSLASLLSELVGLREGNLSVLRWLDQEAWGRVGIANNNPVSVRALAYVMAGHIRHHLKVLQDRYDIRPTP